MSSDRTIIEKGVGLTGDQSPPATPEAAAADSAATILEPRGAPAGIEPFLNLVPGADFRAYRLEQPLKVASAEADLWRIERRADGGKFVLKLYRYGIHPKAEILQALHQLRHEDVVDIVESGEQDGRSFEIQEFVENGSLADLLKRGPVNEAQARNILSELANSVAHLHEANVLHRDIKPSNVLVRSLEPVDLILTDFGISSLSGNSLHLTNVNRTAAYCAPEALTGVVARASDWWSVGVVAIEMLTGRHPLAGLSEQVVNFQLVSKGIPIPSEIPAAWQPLLKGLLTRDHEKRWGADQVRAWLAGRRDIPVHFDSQPTVIPEGGRKPYKFGNQEFLEPRELGAAMAQKWAEAVKHCGWEFLPQWVENDLGDERLSGMLLDVASDPQVSPDEKAAVAILLLNPELPLIFKGQIVDLNWCQQNTAVALALAKSPAQKWFRRLKKESCLEPWAAQHEARKKELDQFGIPLDPAVVERLLASPEISVISAAHEQRRYFAASTLPKLEPLLKQPVLSFPEAVALLACDRALLLTAAQKTHQDKLDRLRAFGVELDWTLAERLVMAENWELVRPLWEETLALWRRRQHMALPLSNPAFPAILKNPSPDYMDAVAVIANRLDFVNGLGMRFLSVPGMTVLFSAWATRLQDYQAFVQATARSWKPPAFPQTPLHPVVNVSWDDAAAFCQWLTEKERQEGRIGKTDEYRLSFDLEWSRAVGLAEEGNGLPINRAGKIEGIYPWGTQWPPPANVGNLAAAVRCDPFTHTAPVGSFAPNRYGIYDLGTNVSEWCWDWYDPGQQLKTLRGASWFQSTPESLWSSVRRFFVPGARSDSLGFRCVLAMRTLAKPKVEEPQAS